MSPCAAPNTGIAPQDMPLYGFGPPEVHDGKTYWPSPYRCWSCRSSRTECLWPLPRLGEHGLLDVTACLHCLVRRRGPCDTRFSAGSHYRLKAVDLPSSVTASSLSAAAKRIRHVNKRAHLKKESQSAEQQAEEITDPFVGLIHALDWDTSHISSCDEGQEDLDNDNFAPMEWPGFDGMRVSRALVKVSRWVSNDELSVGYGSSRAKGRDMSSSDPVETAESSASAVPTRAKRPISPSQSGPKGKRRSPRKTIHSPGTDADTEGASPTRPKIAHSRLNPSGVPQPTAGSSPEHSTAGLFTMITELQQQFSAVQETCATLENDVSEVHAHLRRRDKTIQNLTAEVSALRSELTKVKGHLDGPNRKSSPDSSSLSSLSEMSEPAEDDTAQTPSPASRPGPSAPTG